MPKIWKKLSMPLNAVRGDFTTSLSSSDNIINLGKNCLNIRKGVGQRKGVVKPTKLNLIDTINQNKSEIYGVFFWENEKKILDKTPDFVFEDSLPCAFGVVRTLASEFTYMGALHRSRAETINQNIADFGEKLAPRLDIFQVLSSLTKNKITFIKMQKRLRLPFTYSISRSVSKVLSLRVQVNTKNTNDLGFNRLYKRLGLAGGNIVKKMQIITNRQVFRDKRYTMYYDALVAKEYFRALRRSKAFPMFESIKRTVFYAHMSKTKRKTIAVANIGEQSERHPTSQFNSVKKYLTATINTERFQKWEYKTKTVMSFTNFYKTVWRYFKLKLERYFYKKLGVRMHIWFMNIWDIFMTGVDSYWRWFKFEDQKIFAMTRKGQRYLIEDREEAKFYLRSMALTLTFGGGVKLFINKVTEMLRQYRNNWAFITYTMESLRLCGNFFWFRFFLNYKITLQGKIGGILRAAKKTFKKGDVTIEDRSAVVVHHRTFPQSKFGTYCLGFWMQYRVPNLIGTFDELEYIDTMRVLLSMYTIPWLSTRLTEIIEAILREQEIKKQIKFNQYNRRQRARGLMAKIFNSKPEPLYLKKIKNPGQPVPLLSTEDQMEYAKGAALRRGKISQIKKEIKNLVKKSNKVAAA